MSHFPSWSLFYFKRYLSSVSSLWLLKIQNNSRHWHNREHVLSAFKDVNVSCSWHPNQCGLILSDIMSAYLKCLLWQTNQPEQRTKQFLTWLAYFFSSVLFYCRHVRQMEWATDLEKITTLWLCVILSRIKLSVLLNKETLSYSFTIKVF